MRHDLLRIELILALGRGPWLALVLKRLAFVLATEQLLASLRKNSRRPSGVRRPSATHPHTPPQLFILASSVALTSRDLHRDLIEPVVDLSLASAATRVPSIDTTPRSTNPAFCSLRGEQLSQRPLIRR